MSSLLVERNNSNSVVQTQDSTVANTTEVLSSVVFVPSTNFVTYTETSNVVVDKPTTQVIAAGQPGPPGINEEDMTYSKRVDFISESLLYKGEAAVGSLETDPVWRVRRITMGTDGDVTELWADGSDKFTKVWADRLTLSYT